MHRTFIKLILLTLFIALTGGLVYIPSAQGGTEAEMHTYYLPNFVWHKYFLNSSIILNNPTNTDTIATLIFTPLPVGAPTQVLYSLTAHQTLLVDDRNLFLSLPGVYTVRILADQEVESLVNIYRVRGNALSTYRGLPDEGKTELFFGPMNPLTWATIQNVSYNIALGTMNLYDYSGSLVSSNPYTISPLGLFSRNSSTVPVVPDFQGWMAAVGDQSIVGIISQKVQLPSGEIRFDSMRPALSKGEVMWLARVMKGVDEDGGARTTKIFIANPGNDPVTGGWELLSQDGSTAYSADFTLAAWQASLIDLDTIAELPEGGAWVLRAWGAAPIVLAGPTGYRLPSPTTSVLDFTPGSGNTVNLARLAKTALAHSSFSILNTGAAATTATVTLYDTVGGQVTSFDVDLPVRGWQRYDLRTLAGLGDTFEGSAVISAGQPLHVVVDEFYLPCDPPTGLTISRIPDGYVFEGNSILFEANVNGTGPITFGWDVDGVAMPDIDGAVEVIIGGSGEHYAHVYAENACGITFTTLYLTVEPPTPFQPDLSDSTMSADPPSAIIGDVITYTLMLRNIGQTPAAASLLNPLPAGMSLVEGSAQASDGRPVTFAEGALQWNGSIAYGSPVVLTYQLQLDTLPAGALVNSATLEDGLGNQVTLNSEIAYSSGYSITINGGDETTNSQSVNLAYRWNTNQDILYFMVSNDISFTPGSETSEWLLVDPDNPVVTGWNLGGEIDLKMPRSVYIRFKDRDGVEYSVYSDDILYDPTPPEIIAIDPPPDPNPLQWNMLQAAEPSSYRVQTYDDNSGVQEIQLSQDPSFATVAFTTPCRGRVTVFLWQPPLVGPVYARVVDRSGNFSSIIELFPMPKLYMYLPLLVRR